jgi:hypothetical protein
MFTEQEGMFNKRGAEFNMSESMYNITVSLITEGKL